METPPFEIDENGWGEFQVQIKLFFKNPSIRPLQLTHHLKLYPDDNTEVSTVISEKHDKLCIENGFEWGLNTAALDIHGKDFSSNGK